MTTNPNKFQPLTVPLKDGSKFFLYFKQFDPQKLSVSPTDQSLYEILKGLNNPNQKPRKQSYKGEVIDGFPTKRTLLCINLDREFKEEKVKKLFRILGKIRKISIGNFKNTKKIEGGKIPKVIHFALIIFQKSEDVRKAFETDWFQSRINEKYKLSNLKADQNDKEKYAFKMLENYDIDSGDEDKKKDFIQKMEEDGFTMVLNNQGTVNLQKEPEANPSKKPQKPKVLDDFYKFQVQAKEFLGEEENIKGMDPAILMKRKKRRLIEDFEKDKEKLKKIKKD